MSLQLSTECLIKIFEILEDDKIALHSCLLVSRLWCKLSVRILWKYVWSERFSGYQFPSIPSLDKAIFNTLIACLPNESKKLLNKNEIFISTPTSKPPLFNYAAFCKVLSISMIGNMVDYALNGRPCCVVWQGRLIKNRIVTEELLKMFMNQISSLKGLTCYPKLLHFGPSEPPFIYYPGARDCLPDLSELCCGSDVNSEFFNELSQICHNLHSLSIKINGDVSNELKELISSQNNLKSLKLFAYKNNLNGIISTLTKHSNTLTKLYIYSVYNSLPLSFVSLFSNLQELKFSFISNNGLNLSINEYFNGLQYVAFPKLKTLKIPYNYPTDYLMKFLEINGKNLEEFCIYEEDNALKYIAKFCPNLKKLYIRSNNGELDMLKTIFNSCQYLESVKIMFEERYEERDDLSAKVLESVARYSPKSFHELKIHMSSPLSLCPEELESFFISWKNRTPMRSLSLIIIDDSDDDCYNNQENIKMIKKYIDLNIIKPTKFNNVEDYDDKEDDYLTLDYEDNY